LLKLPARRPARNIFFYISSLRNAVFLLKDIVQHERGIHKEFIMFVRLPACLRQTLAVYGHMRSCACSRGRAAAFVAKDEGVGESTVRSALTRGLGLRSREFDLLTAEGNRAAFQAYLVEKFPEYAAEIATALGNAQGDHHRREQAALHEHIARELTQWSLSDALPQDIRKSMADLAAEVLEQASQR
jgi:hypothetical protein